MGLNRSDYRSFTRKISGLTVMTLLLSLFFVANVFSDDGLYFMQGATENQIAFSVDGAPDETVTIDMDGLGEDGLGMGSMVPSVTGLTTSSELDVTFDLGVSGAPFSMTASGALGVIIQQEDVDRVLHAVVNPIQVAPDGTVTVPSNAVIHIWGKRTSGTFYSSDPIANSSANVVTSTGTGLSISMTALIAAANGLYDTMDMTGYYTFAIFISSSFPVGYYDSVTDDVTLLPQIGLTDQDTMPYLRGSGGIFWDDDYTSNPTISDSLVNLLADAYVIQGRLQVNGATASGLGPLTPPEEVIPTRDDSSSISCFISTLANGM